MGSTRSDNVQVLALTGIMLAAIVIAVVSWGMIPGSQPAIPAGTPTPGPTTGNTGNSSLIINNTHVVNESAPDSGGHEISSTSSVPEGSPSSIVKYTDGKLGSELKSDGTAEWNQQITSTANAKIGYNRLSWDNVFYDNLYGGGNMKLQVTIAFTDSSGWDCQRNKDGIGYHGTWAPTTTTWVVTSETWNPRWSLGVTHSYSPDFAQQGSCTDITGLHYKTFE